MNAKQGGCQGDTKELGLDGEEGQHPPTPFLPAVLRAALWPYPGGALFLGCWLQPQVGRPRSMCETQDSFYFFRELHSSADLAGYSSHVHPLPSLPQSLSLAGENAALSISSSQTEW